MLKLDIQKELAFFTLKVRLEIGNETVALLGRSGAGKSTLLRLIAGLIQPDTGYIRLGDTMLFDAAKAHAVPSHKRNIGFVFQEYALFPHLTVMQNVLYSKKSSAVEAKKLLSSFGIEHLALRYPRELSGGEQQRVALGRALLANPRLLLLDEPFNSLDHDTAAFLRREFKDIQARWGIPCLIVTHNEEEAAFLGDRMLRLEEGCLDALHEEK